MICGSMSSRPKHGPSRIKAVMLIGECGSCRGEGDPPLQICGGILGEKKQEQAKAGGYSEIPVRPVLAKTRPFLQSLKAAAMVFHFGAKCWKEQEC